METIEDNVAPPPAKAKRGRKPKVSEAGTSSIGLINALKFVSAAQKEMGVPYQTHCIINNHWCVAFDGLLTIGCKVEEDVKACPNTFKLLSALQKCGSELAISQLNEHVLSIKSNKFKASIDCVKLEDLPVSHIDEPQGPINDEIKKAFEALAWLATEGAERPFASGVLLQSGSAVATNGYVILEYWHGLNLPPNILIPKPAVNVIKSVAKALKALGVSDRSATFYFEDDSFIKTQLVDLTIPYPNYLNVFENAGKGDDCVLPKDFLLGLEAVAGFSEDKLVLLNGDKIQSHNEAERGATYDLEGLPLDIALNAEYLKAVSPYLSNTKFGKNGVGFSNGNVRGVIARAVKT